MHADYAVPTQGRFRSWHQALAMLFDTAAAVPPSFSLASFWKFEPFRADDSFEPLQNWSAYSN